MTEQYGNSGETREEIIERLVQESLELGHEHLIGMNRDELVLEIYRMGSFTEVAMDAYSWLSSLYPESAKTEGIRIIREGFGADTALQEFVLDLLYANNTSDAIDLIIEKLDDFALGVLGTALFELGCSHNLAADLPKYSIAVEKTKQRVKRLNDDERTILGQNLKYFEEKFK